MDSDARLFLQTQLVTDSGLSFQPQVTAKGCIQLPDSAGRLMVSAPLRQSSLFFAFKESSPFLIKAALVKSPTIKVSTPCTSEGFFASNKLPRQWSFDTSGDLQGTRITVRAIKASGEKSFEIFNKDFGESRLNLPEEWDLRDLPEGLYRLEATYQDLQNGFGVVPQLLNDGSDCSLTVLRNKPSLVYRAATGKSFQVVGLDAALPWATDNARSTIYSCMEERSEAAVIPNELPCQPRGVCSNLNAFEASTSIVGKKAGIYDVFLFSRDRASNQSDLACQTVVFSERSPEIRLQWKIDEWNQDGAILKTPQLLYNAEVSMRHPQVERKLLEDTLKCKVDFLLPDKEVVSGRNVLCTTGRCAGQPMGDFVPCDSKVQFSLVNAWKQEIIGDATLRLQVKASDGGSQEAVANRYLILNSSKWKFDTFAAPNAQPRFSPDRLAVDSKGQILAWSYNGGFWRFDGTSWIDDNIDWLKSAASVSFFTDDQGQVFANVFYSNADGIYNEILLQRKDDAWSYRLIQKDQVENLSVKCRGKPFIEQGMACSVGGQLQLIRGEVTTEIETSPTINGQACPIPLESLFESQKVGLWAVCNTEIIQYVNQKWVSRAVVDKPENFVQSYIGFDSEARVWISLSNQRSFSLGFFEGDQYRSVSVEGLPARRPYGEMGFAIHEGRAYFGVHYWNGQLKQWIASFENWKPLFETVPKIESVPGLDFPVWKPDLRTTILLQGSTPLVLSDSFPQIDGRFDLRW
ncbi:MAG TPA: hypothetical protein VFO10_23120, partial [Oligoflexus sp.]|uniref:hypothetical protein n=1 Tax=Oligoflexus sp. TaxID=1971216 RepID=UPI002D7FEB4A